MAKISFIGVGNMGGPMAANLIKAGHDITVCDLLDENLQKAKEFGAKIASNNSDVVKDAEIVISMLPAGKHVYEVYTEHVFVDAPKGALLVDCSTIDVDTARSVISLAQDKGYEMLDAPVSGGVSGASGGGLTFMVGGEKTAFARAKPLFEIMGSTIVHCGDAGNGQAAKICNNMMLGIQMISVAEAFTMAEKLGLSHQKLFDVAANASGQCWSLTTYSPVPDLVPSSPSNNDFEPGFAAALMLKDLRLALAAAESSGAATPLGEHAEQLYSEFVELGSAEKDFSGIIEMLREI